MIPTPPVDESFSALRPLETRARRGIIAYQFFERFAVSLASFASCGCTVVLAWLRTSSSESSELINHQCSSIKWSQISGPAASGILYWCFTTGWPRSFTGREVKLRSLMRKELKFRLVGLKNDGNFSLRLVQFLVRTNQFPLVLESKPNSLARDTCVRVLDPFRACRHILYVRQRVLLSKDFQSRWKYFYEICVEPIGPH